MDHREHCDALEVEVGRFAAVQAAVDPEAPVPSCPGWSVTDLASHLGTVHRWAEHLVRVQASERISPDSAGIERGPATPEWILDGGTQLVATLRASDPEAEMWAWGRDQHVRFWSRRQLHETLVHRMDAELAARRLPESEPEIAADAIDEFLVNLPAAARFSPNVGELRGDGRRLRLHATECRAAWTITFTPEGFVTSDPENTPADAELSAPVTSLLGILYRRLPRDTPGAVINGDASLVDFWLAHSALQ